MDDAKDVAGRTLLLFLDPHAPGEEDLPGPCPTRPHSPLVCPLLYVPVEEHLPGHEPVGDVAPPRHGRALLLPPPVARRPVPRTQAAVTPPRPTDHRNSSRESAVEDPCKVSSEVSYEPPAGRCQQGGNDRSKTVMGGEQRPPCPPVMSYDEGDD